LSLHRAAKHETGLVVGEGLAASEVEHAPDGLPASQTSFRASACIEAAPLGLHPLPKVGVAETGLGDQVDRAPTQDRAAIQPACRSSPPWPSQATCAGKPR
jgi:hypothetical protein